MRVALKKMLVFSLKASSCSGSVERSVVIGPSCRQATEKFDGSSLRPSGCPHPPFRACEMKQVTPGIVEVTHANLIAGRSESEGRADASKIVGARKARCGEKQHRR